MSEFSPDGFVGALSDVVVSDETLDATLQRVAELATHHVDGCDIAAITLLRDGRPVTAVCTDPTAVEIDAAQYETGVGPCLDAFRHNDVFRITDTRSDGQWPDFANAAAAHGVLSTLSLPLAVGTHSLGALNLYSGQVSSFSEQFMASVFARQAAVVLANAQAYWAAQQLASQLEIAISTRAVIEQAKGALIATHRCTPEEAFEMLRIESQHSNRKLRDVAADELRSVHQDSDGSADAP